MYAAPLLPWKPRQSFSDQECAIMSVTVSQSPRSSPPTYSKQGSPTDSRLASRKHAILPPISTSPPHTATAGDPPTINGRSMRSTAAAEDQGQGHSNPFVMPPTSELFTLRERERQKLKEERARERLLHVHEKTTYASRLNAKTASLRKQVLTPERGHHDPGVHGAGAKDGGIHEDTQFVLTTTKDRHFEKEDLVSYVNRKREMFLVQYSLGVKREEIRKLEEIAKAEEKKLQAAEKYLEESATMFDEFLKENNKNAVEAIKMAEAAIKAKLEKVAEIKRLNAQLMATKNEISRNNDALNELRMYRKFLDSLAPQEWRDQQASAKEMRRRKSSTASTSSAAAADKRRLSSKFQDGGTSAADSAGAVGGGGGKGKNGRSGDEKKAEEEVWSSSDEEGEVELYFTDPQQLIAIFTELEEQNLSLIQNSQETEETLEDIKQQRKATEQRMNRETQNLLKQIEMMKAAVAREEEKAYELEIKSKLYSYGEYKAEDQEQMLAQLDKKVAGVYTKVIGPNDANIPALQMLAAIESRLEELFETIESLPPEKVEAAEKAKEKERRMRLREEKMEEQRLAQEERLRRALERAQADPKKRMGRKLVYRSEPPVLKRKQKERDEQKQREEEELQYFFS